MNGVFPPPPVGGGIHVADDGPGNGALAGLVSVFSTLVSSPWIRSYLPTTIVYSLVAGILGAWIDLAIVADVG